MVTFYEAVDVAEKPKPYDISKHVSTNGRQHLVTKILTRKNFYPGNGCRFASLIILYLNLRTPGSFHMIEAHTVQELSSSAI